MLQFYLRLYILSKWIDMNLWFLFFLILEHLANTESKKLLSRCMYVLGDQVWSLTQT